MKLFGVLLLLAFQQMCSAYTEDELRVLMDAACTKLAGVSRTTCNADEFMFFIFNHGTPTGHKCCRVKPDGIATCTMSGDPKIVKFNQDDIMTDEDGETAGTSSHDLSEHGGDCFYKYKGFVTSDGNGTVYIDYVKFEIQGYHFTLHHDSATVLHSGATTNIDVSVWNQNVEGSGVDVGVEKVDGDEVPDAVRLYYHVQDQCEVTVVMRALSTTNLLLRVATIAIYDSMVENTSHKCAEPPVVTGVPPGVLT